MLKFLRLLNTKFCLLGLIFFGIFFTMFFEKTKAAGREEIEKLYGLKYGDTIYIRSLNYQLYAAVIKSKLVDSPDLLVGRPDLKTGFKIVSPNHDKSGYVKFGDEVCFELEGDKGKSRFIGFSGRKYLIYAKFRDLLGLVSDKKDALKFVISGNQGEVVLSGNIINLQLSAYPNKFFRFNIDWSTYYSTYGGFEIFSADDQSFGLFFCLAMVWTRQLVIEKKGEQFTKDIESERAMAKIEADLPALKKEAEKSVEVNKKVIESLYKIFNLSTDAAEEKIMAAYRKLALVFHPDRPMGNIEIYNKVHQAKDVLIAYKDFNAGKADEAELKLLSKSEVFPKITQTEMKAIETARKEEKKEEIHVPLPWKLGQKPTTEKKGPVVGEKGAISVKWGDEVYIENLKIKKYATRDGNVLVGKKEPSKQASFIIIADLENPDLNKGKPIKNGEAGYFKSSTTLGFIGDSGEEYTIYGKKRTLLGTVTEKDKIYKFTILSSTANKEIYYGKKINLRYRVPTSKSPTKYFRFNVDVSTYKKGTEVFGSDESKLMTPLAKKLTRELTFKRASK